LHARDIMQIMTKTNADYDKAEIVRAARDIYYIPEGTPLNVQLLKFQRNKERIGLVVDEYGDIQGLVTLEDILEEIVGDFTTSIAPAPSESTQVQDRKSTRLNSSHEKSSYAVFCLTIKQCEVSLA